MDHIHVHRDQGVGVLTIARPRRFNALDPLTARDLRSAALKLARDPELRVVVVRGSDGVFCSGADLKDIRDGGDPDALAYLSPAARGVPPGYGEVFKQVLEYLHSTLSEIRRSSKPFIAAVDGVAAAGGLGLALACDLVVASERSTFQYAYFKTGLCGAEGNTFFLPRKLGMQRAAWLALVDPRLSAQEALALGLIAQVFPDETFEDEVDALARRLAEGPTLAFGLAKRLMNEADGVDGLDRHLDRELEALVRSADSQDFAEGIDAFFARRPPRFTGS